MSSRPTSFGDDWSQVHDFALQKPPGLIPCVEDAAAIESKDRQVLEDHALGDIDEDGLGRYSEEGDTSAVSDASKCRVDGASRAAHFEHDIDSKTLVGLDEPVGDAVISPVR